MRIIWLGQAGLCIESVGKKVLIDPYLSDSVGKINPQNVRRVPVHEKFLKIVPDIIICTHNHLDHTDPETLSKYLDNEKRITVLAPGTAWSEVRKFGGSHNYVCFERHSEWSEGEIRMIAVRAEHSDPKAIGVILESEGKRLYITGDTLYNHEIFADLLPFAPLDAVFLPINGVGNNMNAQDAARFAEQTGAKVAVPLHFGLFDRMDGSEFTFDKKVIPEIYKEIKL